MMQPETMAVSSVYEGRGALVWDEYVLGILKRPAITLHRGKNQWTILRAAGCWNRPVGAWLFAFGGSSPGGRTYRFKERGVKPESMHEIMGL